MPHSARLLIAAVFSAAASSALASDDAAAWHAAQRAETAQQALSDRYTAIWSTLDAGEKSRFSAQERAWLNEGRQQELQACIGRAAARTERVARTCEAEVTERHLAALGEPRRIVVSR